MWGDFLLTLLVGAVVLGAVIAFGYVLHVARKRRSPEYRARVADQRRARWQDIERRRAEHQGRKAARTARFAGEERPIE